MEKKLNPLQSNKYRPDIDGLRAIAVLSVVIFHAFPSILTGGFTGVDIFFVISGFLISNIIFENYYNNKFSFFDFYSRRVKRIFPTLIFVLVTTFFLAWFILLDFELKQLSLHLIGGSSFTSNFILWSEASYFDNSADTKPLLHLWSLAIEEQFYIVWPLLVIFFMKRKWNVLILITSIICLSFLYNMINIKQDLTATFYSPFTRFWEISSGSFLAWYYFKKNYHLSITNSNFKNNLIHITSIIGLLLIIYSLYRLNSKQDFPGKWAVIPVLASILVIYSGPNALVNKYLLSNKVLVWIGLISFPLYLWHWPLITLSRIITSNRVSDYFMLCILALSIFLAWISYYFIEKPIRLQSQSKKHIIYLISFMFLISITAVISYWYEGIPSRKVLNYNQILLDQASFKTEKNLIKGCGISDQSQINLFEICAYDQRGPTKFALMGDSKASALHKGLVATSSDKGRWLIIGGTSQHGAPTPLLTNDRQTSKVMTLIATDAIAQNIAIEKVVIVASIRGLFDIKDGTNADTIKSYNHHYLDQLPLVDTKVVDFAFDGLNRTVEKFINAGKKVVIVVDNPVLPSASDCANRKTSIDFVNQLLPAQNPDCQVSRHQFETQISIYKNILYKIQSHHSGKVEIFDATDIYCNQSSGICGASFNNQLLYQYTDHISDYAATLVGQKLNDFLSKSP